MAAHIEGKGCATMNQTGLAQKFGAVVSHVRVAQNQEDILAVRIPAGEADLLLGCDLVVTSTYESMGKVARGRSHTVVNDAEVPTAAFVLDPDAKFPTGAMKDKIVDEVGEEGCDFINATHIATELLGDSIASNLFLLGFAYQRGLVPVSAEALFQAIELNGVAIEFNKEAFVWGRRCAHDAQAVLALVGEPGRKPVIEDLDELIAERAGRLVEYQDEAYSRRYRDFIDTVRSGDPRAGETNSITRAAARNLYKLMAIQEEYEVARLYSDGEFLHKLEQQFEGDYELRFNLAPPLLSKKDPQTGELIKQEYGPWMLKAFGWLAKLRFLRGSALDIFGRTAERRQERADIEDYRALLQDVLSRLDDNNYDVGLELAQLTAQLRGFGHVKDRNREQLTVRREELLRRLRGEVAVDAVKIVEAA